MDQREIGLLIGHIGALQSQILMNQAMNQVCLELIARHTNADLSKVYQLVNKTHASLTFDYLDQSEKLMKRAMDPDSPATVEEILKEFGGKTGNAPS